MLKRPINILNSHDITAEEQQRDGHVIARHCNLGRMMQSKHLGFRVTILPPGQAAWAFHFHHANDEMFYILEGNGSVRLGNQRYAIRQGDVIHCPAGDSGAAHQIINSSDTDLKFLAVSSMQQPDVVEYPDSEKIGVFTGSPPGGNSDERSLTYYGREQDAVSYWTDEPEVKSF